MYINDYGQPIYTTQDVIELLYSNPTADLSKLIIDDDDEVTRYNAATLSLYSDEK